MHAHVPLIIDSPVTSRPHPLRKGSPLHREKNPPGIFNPFGGNAHALGTMKKERRPDWKERHQDIERLFELGLIDIQERGEAIHRILYDEISQELDQMIRVKLEDGF